MSRTSKQSIESRFLDLYYPFHYEVGFAVERAMRDPRLTQLQNVILWTLHSSAEEGRMPRKQLEAILGPWFEVTSSALSKAIRNLTAPPLDLLELRENPASAREKLLILTPNGQAAVNGMKKRGEKFIARITTELKRNEIAEGVNFLSRVSEIVQGFAKQEE